MAARLLGLQILQGAGGARAIELAMPLLHDREKRVRDQAQALLQDLTDQDFPEDQPERWEEWWVAHKADLPQAAEKDLIAYLTLLASSYQSFPLHPAYPIFPGYDGERQMAIWAKRQSDRTLREQRDWDFCRAYWRVARFLHDHMVPKTFRYPGVGVPLGDKDHIVCCYLPKGAERYRAVYGDLSVKDVPPESLPPLTVWDRKRWMEQ